MTKKNEKRSGTTSESRSDEQTTIDYLRRHPTFFDKHPELLETLAIPHRSGGVISLIERQVKHLRQRLKQEQKNIDELVSIARENDALHERLHRVILTLLSTLDPKQKRETALEQIRKEFNTDAIALHLFAENAAEDPLYQPFAELLQQEQIVCGKLEPEQQQLLFAEQKHKLLSVALIPLHYERSLGLLAIASRDENRFTPDHRTDFLNRLSEIFSCNMRALDTDSP
jgi:uncharacterized protein YigA (DUF484 family)